MSLSAVPAGKIDQQCWSWLHLDSARLGGKSESQAWPQVQFLFGVFSSGSFYCCCYFMSPEQCGVQRAVVPEAGVLARSEHFWRLSLGSSQSPAVQSSGRGSLDGNFYSFTVLRGTGHHDAGGAVSLQVMERLCGCLSKGLYDHDMSNLVAS